MPIVLIKAFREVTLKKPDIVIIDKKSKSVHIFELTVPGEARLDTAHKLMITS